MGHLFRRLVPVLLGAALLGGCAALGDIVDLQQRVTDAGYTNVSVNHNTNNGFDSLAVTASKDGAEPDEIGRIVWDTYPEHIDELRLTLNGKALVATESQLKEAYGERKVQVKPDDDEGAVRQVFLWLAIGGVALVLVVVGIIILVVVLVKRSKRRNQPPPPNYPPPPYYQQ